MQTSRKLPSCHPTLKVRLQYIRDLPGCLRNGKLGSDSGPLAVANIRDHCTSGVTPKADVQDFSLKVRKVLEDDILWLDRPSSNQNGNAARPDLDR